MVATRVESKAASMADKTVASWADQMAGLTVVKKAAQKVGLRVVRWVASTDEMMAEKMDVR